MSDNVAASPALPARRNGHHPFRAVARTKMSTSIAARMKARCTESGVAMPAKGRVARAQRGAIRGPPALLGPVVDEARGRLADRADAALLRRLRRREDNLKLERMRAGAHAPLRRNGHQRLTGTRSGSGLRARVTHGRLLVVDGGTSLFADYSVVLGTPHLYEAVAILALAARLLPLSSCRAGEPERFALAPQRP